MAFELLVSFSSNEKSVNPLIKEHVMDWLEARGRYDVVEGIIDGVDMKLTDIELASSLTSEDRLSLAPLAIYDDFEAPLKTLSQDLLIEFPHAVHVKISEISDDSWLHCWQEDFVPLETNQFWIVPMGHGGQTPRGLVRVEIDARDGAFGTGQHTTTRAIIRGMEEFFPIWQPSSLLDVGTGTGIYLVLAGIMGVPTLAGTEISAELVSLANSNCEAHGISADIRLSERPDFGRSFDVIIANILVPVLHDLMEDLKKYLAPGGRLIVAGFVEKEEGPLVAAAGRHQLVVESMLSELGWRCLILKSDTRDCF